MPSNDTQAEALPQTPVHVDHLIDNGELAAENAWCVSYDADALPEQRPASVPLALWQANKEDAELAPLLASDTELNAELASTLDKAPAVAVDFPAFTDGRGYTIARLLRERYGFTGKFVQSVTCWSTSSITCAAAGFRPWPCGMISTPKTPCVPSTPSAFATRRTSKSVRRCSRSV